MKLSARPRLNCNRIDSKLIQSIVHHWQLFLNSVYPKGISMHVYWATKSIIACIQLIFETIKKNVKIISFSAFLCSHISHWGWELKWLNFRFMQYEIIFVKCKNRTKHGKTRFESRNRAKMENKTNNCLCLHVSSVFTPFRNDDLLQTRKIGFGFRFSFCLRNFAIKLYSSAQVHKQHLH